MSSRNTCFTLNNWTEEEKSSILAWQCTYLIFGEEIGENGTPHLQGYVEWGRSVRFTTLKGLNERIHWENRKGSAKQASDYCMKEKKITTLGTISEQGKRSDLDNIAEMIVDGTPMREIALHSPSHYIKYHKGMHALKYILSDDRTQKPYVEWRWGKSGTGKTRYCVEKHPNHYIKDETKWWDGYENQEAIIIDDYDNEWNYRQMLRLLDRNKYQGQSKGGYLKINSPYIYITCEYPPGHYWRGNELEQILRRVAVVAEVTGNTIPSQE